MPQIADLDLVVTDTEMEALALENNFIKRHRPRYNVLLRDDKNHPYLKLTLAEEYPRLHIVRRVAEDGNAYGGPYIPASHGAAHGAAVVHKVFGIRSCKETLNGRRAAALPAVPDRALPGARAWSRSARRSATGRRRRTRGCSSRGARTRW